MNALMKATAAPLTMSSLEIAKLVEKEHATVIRSMGSLADKGLINFQQTVEKSGGRGRPSTLYHVNQRDSYVVVAQLSPEFTAALVDRWQELEKQAAAPQWGRDCLRYVMSAGWATPPYPGNPRAIEGPRPFERAYRQWWRSRPSASVELHLPNLSPGSLANCG